MSNITGTHSSNTTDLSLDDSSDDDVAHNNTKRQRTDESTYKPSELAHESQQSNSPPVNTPSASRCSENKETLKNKFYDGIVNDIERNIIPMNALGKYPMKDNVKDIIELMSTMKKNVAACNEVYTLLNKWKVNGNILLTKNSNKTVTAYEDIFDLIYSIHEKSNFEMKKRELKVEVEKQSGNITTLVVNFYLDIFHYGTKRANPVKKIPLKSVKEEAIQSFRDKLDSFTLKGFINQLSNGGNVVVQRSDNNQHVGSTLTSEVEHCNLGEKSDTSLKMISDYLLEQGQQLLSGFEHHCNQYIRAEETSPSNFYYPTFETMVGLFNRKKNIPKNHMSWLNSVTMIIIHQIPEHVIYAISQLTKNRISDSASFLENRKYANTFDKFAVMSYDLIRQMSCREIKNIATNCGTVIGTPYAGGMAKIFRDHYNTCNSTFQINDKSSIGLKSYFDNGLLLFFDKIDRSEKFFCVGKTTQYEKNLESKVVTKLDGDSGFKGGAFFMKQSQKDISEFESYFRDMRNRINSYQMCIEVCTGETIDNVHSQWTDEEVRLFEEAVKKRKKYKSYYEDKYDIKLYLQLVMKKKITPTELVKFAINNVTEYEKRNEQTECVANYQLYRQIDEYPYVITIVFDSVIKETAYGFKRDPTFEIPDGDESEEDERETLKIITKDFKVEEGLREIPLPFELDMTNINDERIEVFQVPQEVNESNHERHLGSSRYYEVCGMVVTSMLTIDDECDDHYECFVKTRVSHNRKKQKWIHFKNNVQNDDIIFNMQIQLDITEGEVHMTSREDYDSHETCCVPDLSEFRMIAVFMRHDPDYVPRKRSHRRY